jgi:amidase
MEANQFNRRSLLKLAAGTAIAGVPSESRSEMDWPHEIAGKTMATYHEWMKGVLLITMTGCPALAAPAGFDSRGLPIGIQIVAPNHSELECLQLAHSYEQAMSRTISRLPQLLA